MHLVILGYWALVPAGNYVKTCSALHTAAVFNPLPMETIHILIFHIRKSFQMPKTLGLMPLTFGGMHPSEMAPLLKHFIISMPFCFLLCAEPFRSIHFQGGPAVSFRLMNVPRYKNH